MSELAAQLRASLLDRARGFESHVDFELGRLASGGPGLSHALRMFLHYSVRLKDQVQAAWDDSPTELIRVSNIQQWNDHLRRRIIFFDEFFGRGRNGVPHALLSEIERICARSGLGAHEAVVSFGSPINFESFVADLAKFLFDKFDVDPDLPQELSAKRLVLIVVPGAEGARAAWQPIIAGHELGHYFEVTQPIGKRVHLDKGRLNATADPIPRRPGSPAYSRSRALEIIANNWVREILCDAYAVHMYGAGAVAAMADFSSFVSPQSTPGLTHPPRAFRTKLMLSWLQGCGRGQQEIANDFAELAIEAVLPDWASYICDRIEAVAPALFEDVVNAWSAGLSYHLRGRDLVVERLAELLAAGVPGTETVTTPDGRTDVEPADVVNAVWVAFHLSQTKPINRLALKALDTLDFVTRWKDAKGPSQVLPTPQLSGSTGALTEREIARRLQATGAHRLTITPLLAGAVGGASIDLRLGSRFIVFQKSNSAVFDALHDRQDPRSFQTIVDKAWGDVFYLHPGQLVLAATLEYMVIPGDLTAQVITRSSYGRLGLLSATAVQVHPYFAGCLTLELVNLGEMPMAITPGERVAQLVMWTTTGSVPPPRDDDDKYRYPTGPEFSKIRDDKESLALSRMRDTYTAMRGQT